MYSITGLLAARLLRGCAFASCAFLLTGCGEFLRSPTPKSAWLLIPEIAQAKPMAAPKAAKFGIILAPIAANPLLLSDEIWSLQADQTLRAQNAARWALAPDQMLQTSMLAALSDSRLYSAVLNQPQQDVPAHQLSLYLLAFWVDASTPIPNAQVSWDAQLRCFNKTLHSTRISQSLSYELPAQMRGAMRSAFTRALQKTQQWLAEQELQGCSPVSISVDDSRQL